jgi:hypothetical protein
MGGVGDDAYAPQTQKPLRMMRQGFFEAVGGSSGEIRQAIT